MYIDKHKIYLQMARDYSQMSKCRKIKVGCILVNNGRIVSTGVNGTPKGTCNCTDHFYAHDDERFAKEHRDWSNEHEVHAEMNALLYAAKSNVEVTSECILYCTHEPCNNCLKHIAVTGIKQIYYIERYYNNTLDNKYKIDIKQLDLEPQVQTKTPIIVNARKKIYEFTEISFLELVELSFGPVNNPEMYYADYRLSGQENFTKFDFTKTIKIQPNMEFRCSGSTPVYGKS